MPPTWCIAFANLLSKVAKIANWVEFTSLNRSGLHYVVLEEADNLTDAAQRICARCAKPAVGPTQALCGWGQLRVCLAPLNHRL